MYMLAWIQIAPLIVSKKKLRLYARTARVLVGEFIKGLHWIHLKRA
jgi:hypothetical protein